MDRSNMIFGGPHILHPSPDQRPEGDAEQTQESQEIKDEARDKKDETAYGKDEPDKAQANEIKQDECQIVLLDLSIRLVGGDGDNFIVHMI